MSLFFHPVLWAAMPNWSEVNQPDIVVSPSAHRWGRGRITYKDTFEEGRAYKDGPK